MSTDTTPRPVRPVALAADLTPADAPAERAATYRGRIETLRHGYRCRARRNGVAANGVSLLLVAAGAAVGLSPLLPGAQNLTAILGVAVILLEGVTRVLKPALRASRARWVVRRLDREFRLFDARGRSYRGDDEQATAEFVTAVERILERADAAEEHDESGNAPTPSASRKSA